MGHGTTILFGLPGVAVEVWSASLTGMASRRG